MRWFAVAIGLLSFLFASMEAAAQQSYGVHEKAIERLNSAREISPLSVDRAFGEEIGQFVGNVEFSLADVSVPGNNALPVEVRRKLSIDDRSRVNGQHLGGFAEWDLEVPYLSSVVVTSKGWRPSGGTVGQRCSNPGPLESTASVSAEDYWDGYKLTVPGVGGQTLLMNPSSKIPQPTDGNSYPWITKQFWRISCKPSTKNGYPGQSFVALSPQGVKYHMDWVVARSHAGIKGEINSVPLLREVIYFLTTRIEDGYGNWVDYGYSGDKLISISSSDGRSISLTWSGNKIVSVSSAGRNWVYSYAGERLAEVLLPDQSKWTYSSTGGLGISPPVWTPGIEDPTGCPETADAPMGAYGLTVVAPSGARAEYQFQVLQHARSGVPEHACYINSPEYWFMKVPRSNWSLTLVSKVVTGPGVPAMTWTYAYDVAVAGQDPDTKVNTVSGPDGTYTRSTFGIAFNLNEGVLLKSETGSGPAAILQTQSYRYLSASEVANQLFPSSVGDDPKEWSDYLTSSWLRPMKESTTTQNQVAFRMLVNSYDRFARPTSVTKSSAPSP